MPIIKSVSPPQIFVGHLKEIEFVKKMKSVFGERKYVLIAALSAIIVLLVYSILAEMIPLPLPNVSPIRMEPITVLDIVFMAVFSTMSGIAVAFYFYSRSGAREVCAISSGVFFGVLTGLCPFCPIFLITLLGASVTIGFLAPFFPVLRALSLVLLLVSLYWLGKRVKIKRG